MTISKEKMMINCWVWRGLHFNRLRIRFIHFQSEIQLDSSMFRQAQVDLPLSLVDGQTYSTDLVGRHDDWYDEAWFEARTMAELSKMAAVVVADINAKWES